MDIILYAYIASVVTVITFAFLIIHDVYLDTESIIMDIFISIAVGVSWITSIPIYIIYNIVLTIANMVLGNIEWVWEKDTNECYPNLLGLEIKSGEDANEKRRF